MSQYRVKKERPELGDVIEATQDRFDEAWDEFDTIAIAFSGGKDSNSVLQMALDAWERNGGKDRPLQLIHTDDEFVFPETEAFVKRVAQDPRIEIWWCALPVKYRNGCSWDQPWWYPWHPDKQDKWLREKPVLEEIEGAHLVELDHPRMEEFEIGEDEHSTLIKHLLHDQPAGEDYGKILELTGLRASESMARFRGVMVSGGWLTDRKEEMDDVWMGRPVYDWHDPDLWAAHLRFDWDYNVTYDKLAKYGVSPGNMRTAHPYAEESFANREWLKSLWPDLYERAKHRVPGAKAAFEHGKDLFQVKKHEEQTWREKAYQLLAGYEDEELREKQRSRIQNRIDNHHRRATMPLHDTTSCPYCGDSWKRYAKMLYRGDLKGRRL